jgi:DnaJ-class molecular chaperone
MAWVILISESSERETMTTQAEVFYTESIVKKKTEEIELALSEFKKSRALCGCDPMCPFHSNWASEINHKQQLLKEEAVFYQSLYNHWKKTEDAQNMKYASLGYDSPRSNSAKSGSKVCPKCDGKGYIYDHNLLGINDIGEETCYMCKGSGKSVVNHWGKCSTCNGKGRVPKRRGAFDLLFHGGGNRKECPRCHGMGYLD